MLHALTLKAAGKIGGHWQASDWEIKAYAYSMQLIILSTFQYSLYVGISILLGFFKPAIIIITSSVVFRSCAGSWHLSTFPRCLIYSGLSISLAVAAALPVWSDLTRYSAALLTAAVALTSLYRWIPAGIRKRINTPGYRMNQKIKTLIFLLISIMVLMILEYCSLDSYTQLLVSSIGFSVFHTTPWGCKLIVFIDALFNTLTGSKTSAVAN